MRLTTDSSVRNAIIEEATLISGSSGGDARLSESEINDLVQTIMQMPEDARETQMRGMVNDIVQRRLGDPSVSG